MSSESPDTPELRGFRSDQLSGLMLAAIAAYVGWENRAYPLGSLQEPGPGYLPLLLAIFLGATGLTIALRGAKSGPALTCGCTLGHTSAPAPGSSWKRCHAVARNAT